MIKAKPYRQHLRRSSLRKLFCALQFALLLAGAVSLGQPLPLSASGAQSYHYDYLALTSKAERDLGAARFCERDSLDAPEGFHPAAQRFLHIAQCAAPAQFHSADQSFSRSSTYRPQHPRAPPFA